MGFRFRKSFKFPGGFRVNASNSGLGYSWGTKGYRITKTANGSVRRTTTIPGTGISHVEQIKPQSSASKGSGPAGQSQTKKRHGCLTQIIAAFAALFVIFAAFSACSSSEDEPPDIRQIPVNSEINSPSPSPSTAPSSSPSESLSPSEENEESLTFEELQAQTTALLSEQFQLDLVDMQDRELRYDIRVTAAGISDRADQSEAPEDWDDFMIDFTAAQTSASDIVKHPVMLYLLDSSDEIMLTCTDGRIRVNRYHEPPVSSSTQENGRSVWVTNSGKKYHYSSSCSGMNNPHSITISDAISKGYTACDKCA